MPVTGSGCEGITAPQVLDRGSGRRDGKIEIAVHGRDVEHGLRRLSVRHLDAVAAIRRSVDWLLGRVVVREPLQDRGGLVRGRQVAQFDVKALVPKDFPGRD